MRVKDIKTAKENFKKQFGKDCNGTFSVSFKPADKYIRIATTDRFNSVRELYIDVDVDWETRNVYLYSVDRLDVVWDFIWSKDGFWMECYKNSYRDLEVTSVSNGTRYTCAEVVFNTKRKRYIYHSFETNNVLTIE